MYYVMKKIGKEKDSNCARYELIGEFSKVEESIHLKVGRSKKCKPCAPLFDLNRYLAGVGADPNMSFLEFLSQQMQLDDPEHFGATLENWQSILKNARLHVAFVSPAMQASILRVFNDFVQVDVSLKKFGDSIGNYWELMKNLPASNTILQNMFVQQSPCKCDVSQANRKLVTLYMYNEEKLKQRQQDLADLETFFKTKGATPLTGATPFEYFLPYAKSLRTIEALEKII